MSEYNIWLIAFRSLLTSISAAGGRVLWQTFDVSNILYQHQRVSVASKQVCAEEKGEYTSNAAWISPDCEELEKLHPRGPTRLFLSPIGHSDPMEAKTGQERIMIKMLSESQVCGELE
jgi:hypothetical protein